MGIVLDSHLPEVHDQLIAELETLSDFSDPIAVARLPYLNAVCSETLRIYPIAMLTLELQSAQSKLMDYEFEPGTTLLVPCIYLTHRREDLYPQAEAV
jgi:cytochrome P450